MVIKKSSITMPPQQEIEERPINPKIGDKYYNWSRRKTEVYTSLGWMVTGSKPSYIK